MGRVILFLLLLLHNLSAWAETRTYVDLFHFHQGILQSDEVWSGKNLILGDVIVPENLSLTIAPDSWLVFNEADLNNAGNKPERPELIVFGKLIKPSGTDAIHLFSLSDPTVQNYIQQNTAEKAIAIAPNEETLADLEKNLHESKRYYAWLWVAVYSIWLIL